MARMQRTKICRDLWQAGTLPAFSAAEVAEADAATASSAATRTVPVASCAPARRRAALWQQSSRHPLSGWRVRSDVSFF